MTKHRDVLVVGAGFAGAVCARSLADSGFDVRIIDRRDHLGGNAWDRVDEQGILVHPYGPHIFHTNSDEVLSWLSRFTAWRPYTHRVLAHVDGVYFPIPINRTTINRFYGINLSEGEVGPFLASIREARDPICTSEDVVLNTVGRRLCETFFSGYTRKQWGRDLRELAVGVAARIPVRTNDDDRYFSDKHQCMPRDGYSKLFERMLTHPQIDVQLGRTFEARADRRHVRHTVYTGPIDEFFGFRFGRLGYRSLRFEHFHVANVGPASFVQVAPVVNFPCEHAYTRISEFKQMTGQVHSGSSLVREIPCDDGDPFYPIPCKDNDALYERYRLVADEFHDVSFVGRLAQYRYYNMDQVVAASLRVARIVAARLAAQCTSRMPVAATKMAEVL